MEYEVEGVWPALVVEWLSHRPQCTRARVEALVHPLRESSLLKARVHAIGLFLDRHRGLTCVLFKM